MIRSKTTSDLFLLPNIPARIVHKGIAGPDPDDCSYTLCADPSQHLGGLGWQRQGRCLVCNDAVRRLSLCPCGHTVKSAWPG
jgi:hypothetical protein